MERSCTVGERCDTRHCAAMMLEGKNTRHNRATLSPGQGQGVPIVSRRPSGRDGGVAPRSTMLPALTRVQCSSCAWVNVPAGVGGGGCH